MDPLNDGDNGALGSVFDTITGTVGSIEQFGQKVGDATTFNMSVAMIWAVILFMFLTLFIRLAKPWNDGAAERWRSTGRIFEGAVPRDRRSKDEKIADLEDRLAAALAQIAAFHEANASLRETGT
jgi:hypothetical protein